MKTLIEMLKIYLLTSFLKVKRSMHYRVDFITGLIIASLLSFMGPIFQYLVFQKSSGYLNWNTDQIILYQGVMVLWYGLKDSLFGDLRSHVEQICTNGLLDMLLLKPYPAIGLLLSRGFFYQSLSAVFVGTGIILYSVKRLALNISFVDGLLFLMIMFFGLVAYASIMIVYCAITVKVIRTFRLSEILDKLLIFSQFPTDIYTPVMRTVFYVVVPIALWIYFPTQVLLDRLNHFVVPGLVSSLLAFILSLMIWNFTLRKYTSAGG
jgi:ABC-2 type transport system permease protein